MDLHVKIPMFMLCKLKIASTSAQLKIVSICTFTDSAQTVQKTEGDMDFFPEVILDD